MDFVDQSIADVSVRDLAGGVYSYCYCEENVYRLLERLAARGWIDASETTKQFTDRNEARRREKEQQRKQQQSTITSPQLSDGANSSGSSSSSSRKASSVPPMDAVGVPPDRIPPARTASAPEPAGDSCPADWPDDADEADGAGRPPAQPSSAVGHPSNKASVPTAATHSDPPPSTAAAKAAPSVVRDEATMPQRRRYDRRAFAVVLSRCNEPLDRAPSAPGEWTSHMGIVTGPKPLDMVQWDYHVIALIRETTTIVATSVAPTASPASPSSSTSVEWYVADFDSKFTSPMRVMRAAEYCTRALNVAALFRPFAKIVAARDYLAGLRTDRWHMVDAAWRRRIGDRTAVVMPPQTGPGSKGGGTPSTTTDAVGATTPSPCWWLERNPKFLQDPPKRPVIDDASEVVAIPPLLPPPSLEIVGAVTVVAPAAAAAAPKVPPSSSDKMTTGEDEAAAARSIKHNNIVHFVNMKRRDFVVESARSGMAFSVTVHVIPATSIVAFCELNTF